MGLNILLGTHSTGKTTLCQSLQGEVEKLYITDGFSRPVKVAKESLNLNNIQEQTIINELTKWAFINYLNQIDISVLSTRSPIDAIVYSKYFTPSIDTSELLELFRANKHRVSNFFYIPIEFPIINDGVRFMDPKIQLDIQNLIIEFCQQENVNLINVTGSILKRTEFITPLIY